MARGNFPKLPGLPKIKKIRPVKPIDKLQNIMPIGKPGQTEGVKGHWRFNEKSGKYHWVMAHPRKPGR
jgi:hypothetical protein